LHSGEPKRQNAGPHVNYWNTALSIFLALSVSSALADDIKTNSGKEYKNATVTRVEPDGVTVKFSGGVVKIPFAELSKELQARYHYDPEASQKFAADTAAQINANNAVVAANTKTKKQEENAETLLRRIRIFAIIKPFIYGEKQTTAHIQEFAQYWKGPTAYDFDYTKVGKEFTGVIDEPMPEYFERGDTTIVTLYKMGHSDDSSRDPLFTMDKQKAMQIAMGGSK